MSGSDIFKWIRDKDPATIPYRPGAPFIYDGFGLRRWMNFGSPLHTGPDRAGLPDVLLHPFGGVWLWKFLGNDSPFGSLLRIMPGDDAKIEVQVAHTTCDDGKNIHSGRCDKGEQIQGIHVASLGSVSSEAHTHTDVLIPATEENLSHLRDIDPQWVAGGKIVDESRVEEHCAKWDIPLREYTVRVVKQLSSWGISEAGRHYLVRKGVPAYRKPFWGAGAVIFLDSQYFLNI